MRLQIARHQLLQDPESARTLTLFLLMSGFLFSGETMGKIKQEAGNRYGRLVVINGDR